MTTPNIGWSEFAAGRHKKGTGFSYSTLTNEQVVQLVREAWDKRQPGMGEATLDRKIVVPVQMPEGTYFNPVVALREDLPVYAKVTRRQDGEDLFIETFTLQADVDRLGLEYLPDDGKNVGVVVYSAAALEENGGKRTTEDPWEIVTYITLGEKMTPLTMARNFLGKAGGTVSAYTSQEFAEAIYEQSTKGGVRVKARA